MAYLLFTLLTNIRIFAGLLLRGYLHALGKRKGWNSGATVWEHVVDRCYGGHRLHSCCAVYTNIPRPPLPSLAAYVIWVCAPNSSRYFLLREIPKSLIRLA